MSAGRFREDYLRRWVAEDESKTLEIRCDEKARLRVTIWKGRGGELLRADLPARWHDANPTAEASADARWRLGYLCVELGMGGLGTTYDLFFAAEQDDENAPGGFRWRAVRSGDPIEAVRVFPQGGASWFEYAMGWWDDKVQEMNEAEQGWIEPLSTYLPESKR
jgi:hypothetical protein